MKIQEIILPDDLSVIKLNRMSFVTEPAIELDAILLSKQQTSKNYILSKPIDNNRILSAALVPDKLIPRKNDNGEIYYITFSKDTVKKLSYHYMMTSQKFTVQHENQVSDCYVIENWIVEDTSKDKTAFYNYPVQEGTWMMMSQVNNDYIMNKYRSGELRGLSMELQIVKSMEKYGKIYNSKEISEKELQLRNYCDNHHIKYDDDIIEKIMKIKW